jgi:hypothetical protein
MNISDSLHPCRLNYWAVRLFDLALLALLLAACQNSLAAPASAPSVTPDPGTLTPPPEQAKIWSAWARSPHANTYSLEKGPNTYCARCHSPENWDSTAKIDSPPNCLSCKFPNEPEARTAASNSLVSKEDWMNIRCEVCHTMENGLASQQVAWLDAITGYHETISQPDQLCEKCHTDTATLQHGIDLGVQVHVGFSCIDCHDPHSTVASCVSSGCHADVMAERLRPSRQHANLTSNDQCETCHPDALQIHSMETQRVGSHDCLSCHTDKDNVPVEETSPPQHSTRHALVDCVACHDASGLDIGVPEGSTTWTTFRTVQSVLGTVTEAYPSHNLQKLVSCQKCHFPGNPWGLPESVVQ